MAHIKYLNSEQTKVNGSIKRGIQLVRSQFTYLEEHPELAPKNYRQLSRIALKLEKMSHLQPTRVDVSSVYSLLAELSSIVWNLQNAA
jgi:sensor domain CHASE-containing protein